MGYRGWQDAPNRLRELLGILDCLAQPRKVVSISAPSSNVRNCSRRRSAGGTPVDCAERSGFTLSREIDQQPSERFPIDAAIQRSRA